MNENLIPELHPFNIDVATRWWESDANECKPGHFNEELYKLYLKAIYQ